MRFETITNDALVTVAGGAATSQADLQLQQMLTDISGAIKDAVDAKNKAASDPTQMMTMMMLMGGLGGGGAAAAPPPAQPVVEQPAPNVVRVRV